MLGPASGATLASILAARRDFERSPMEGVVGDREEWMAEPDPPRALAAAKDTGGALRTAGGRAESRVRSRA
jgi:hypothetical protein